MTKPLLKNPSPHALYMRAWRARNPDNALYQKQYREHYSSIEENREAARLNANLWRKNNPEQKKKSNQHHYENNKARYRELNKLWMAENLERHREYQRRYQSGRKAKTPSGIVNFDEVIDRCNNVCGICGGAIEGKFHFDHIIPIAANGKHETDNIQQSHPRCNLVKNARVGFSMKPIEEV